MFSCVVLYNPNVWTHIKGDGLACERNDGFCLAQDFHKLYHLSWMWITSVTINCPIIIQFPMKQDVLLTKTSTNHRERLQCTRIQGNVPLYDVRLGWTHFSCTHLNKNTFMAIVWIQKNFNEFICFSVCALWRPDDEIIYVRTLLSPELNLFFSVSECFSAFFQLIFLRLRQA